MNEGVFVSAAEPVLGTALEFFLAHTLPLYLNRARAGGLMGILLPFVVRYRGEVSNHERQSSVTFPFDTSARTEVFFKLDHYHAWRSASFHETIYRKL